MRIRRPHRGSAPCGRLAALGLAGALALTGCADDGDGGGAAADDGDQGVDAAAAEEPVVTTAPEDDTIRDAREATRTTIDDAVSSDEEEDADWRVAAEVSVAEFGTDDFAAEVEMAFDPDVVADPFGEFGACSGLRTEIGAYSVIISHGGAVEFVELATSDRVTAPGIYDADVRIERSGEAYAGSGTVTILDGLQSGSFTAFGPGGGRIEGAFECSGAPSPAPLTVGDPSDSTLDSVEVFALIRRGDDDRVVGMATSDARLAACPAVEGGRGDDVIVSAVGNAELGSISGLELTDSSFEIVVAGTPFSFGDVSLSTIDGADGTFVAVGADGLSIDGAFRCS